MITLRTDETHINSLIGILVLMSEENFNYRGQ